MNYVWAFMVGGAICVIGQLFIDYTKLTPARILTGYVVAGVVLSAVGVYKPLAEFAGAGASVPLLGFGHLLAQGVVQAVDRCGLPGAFTGGLTAAAGGVASSLIFAVAAALVNPRKDALLQLNITPQERARLNALIMASTVALSSPFGYLAGWLSSMDRRLPFVFTLLLFVTAMFAIGRIQEPQVEER